MHTNRLRFLQLEPGEPWLVLWLGFLLFGHHVVRQVTGIVAVSGFLSTSVGNQILVVLLIDYSIILVISLFQSLIVDRFSRTHLMGGMCLAFSLSFILMRLLFFLQAPEWLNYAVLYILGELQFVFFPLFFWVLANDSMNIAQAKRIFPVLSGFGFVGKLVGIGVAVVSPVLFEAWKWGSEEILLINASIYLLLFVSSVWGASMWGIRALPHRQAHSQPPQNMMQNLREGWDFSYTIPSFRYLMAGILMVAISYTIIEFRFLMVSNSAFVSRTAYQQFYSLYRLGVTLASFLIQATVSARLISWFKLKNVFMILPVLAVFSSLATLLFSGLPVAVAALVILRITRDTVDESAGYTFLGLVPEERRGRVTTFMDSYVPAIGIIVACVITQSILWAGEALGVDVVPVYLGIAGVAAGFSVFGVWRMRKTYDDSLLDWRLKRRQRGVKMLEKMEL